MSTIVEDAREVAHRVGERMSSAAHRAADEAALVGRRIIDKAPAVDSVIDDVEGGVQKVAYKLRAPLRELSNSQWPLGTFGARMLWPSVFVAGALAIYELEAIMLVRARIKYGVKGLQGEGRHVITPESNLPVPYEHQLRTHQTTAEQLVTFIPGMFAFSVFCSTKWAAIIGGVWFGGRLLANYGSKIDATLERLGHTASVAANWALLLGSAVNIVRYALTDIDARLSGDRLVSVDEDIALTWYNRGARVLRAQDDIQMGK